MIEKNTAVETVKKWIESSVTLEQLDCCALFIQDTLYMRFNADSEVIDLKARIYERKQVLNGQ